MADDKTKKFERVPSTIQFPYTDMADAIAVAEGLLKGGGVPMSRDQLAAAMNLAPGGGGFATKVSTARMFGVIETIAGKYQLTELGFEIVDSGRQGDAKVRAFLSVELFKRTYDEFRGKMLPPRPLGLEAAFVTFGVTTKNARVARLSFEKSARMAGLYPNGNEDRLVMPFGVGPTFAQVEEAPESLENKKAALVAALSSQTPRAFDSGPSLHPSISGMLSELPPPKSDWSKAEQADWLDALAGMFRVIYKSPGEAGDITVTYTP